MRSRGGPGGRRITGGRSCTGSRRCWRGGARSSWRSWRRRVGRRATQGKREVEVSIDRTLYYAGWADKYQQVFSSVNPVASSHFNFSVLEPTGVVSILAPEESSLLGLV